MEKRKEREERNRAEGEEIRGRECSGVIVQM